MSWLLYWVYHDEVGNHVEMLERRGFFPLTSGAPWPFAAGVLSLAP